MQVRHPRPILGVAILVLATGLATIAAPASAATTWTAPRRIPGTVGLANPYGATAPDGTDVVLWLEGTDVALQNAVHARVRLPASERWRTVPVRLKGQYLQDMVIAPTPGGDFWVAYQVGISGVGQQVRLARLDSEGLHWSRPVKVFRSQTGYGHAGAAIGLGGDGTLVVGSYAKPFASPAADPVYRVAVTMKRPGGAWRTSFLSPAGGFATGADVAVNDVGDVVVAFMQGYGQADETARAATMGHRTTSWKIRTLSDVGDGYGPQAAIGDDGTAAVVWSASATALDAIRMATIKVNVRLDPWVGRNVVTGAAYSLEPHVVVAPNGHVTVVWRQGSGANLVLRVRHLAGNTLSDALTLTPAGKDAAFAITNALALRPDGKVALLYQLYTPAIHGLGLRFQTLNEGVPGTVKELTGDVDVDGAVNGASLGIDGRSRATVIYTRGDYPDTDFAWLGQVPGTVPP